MIKPDKKCESITENRFITEYMTKIASTALDQKGKSRAEFDFFQCSKCGNAWPHEIDSGLGRHVNSKINITKGYI